MEHWKRNDLTLHVRDSEDVPIIMSNDEEVEAPPSSEESYIVPPLCYCSLFQHIFFTILSNFKPSFFPFTHSQFTSNKDKAQEIII